MCEITIVSANNNSPTFARLLVESIRKFTKIPYEIIIADSGSTFINRCWLKEQSDIHLWEAKKKIDRSLAIRYAIENGKGKYICFLDIDSFILDDGWARGLIDLYEENDSCKLITHVGKPIHESLLFTDKEWLDENHVPVEHLYEEVLNHGYTIKTLKTTSGKHKDKRTAFLLNGIPMFYHFGYGTQFNEHNPPRKEKIGDYSLEEYFANKTKLLGMSLVCDLLGTTPHMAEQTYKYKDYMLCRDLMSLNDERPWIEPGAIKMLDEKLTRESNVLEVGSGSSTIWFAKQVKRVLSFEGSYCWAAVIKDELEIKGLSNVDLLVQQNYSDEGIEVGDMFDVILVDGISKGRTKIIKNVINHIESRGLFVVDDSQRESYDEGFQMLDNKGWKRTDFKEEAWMRATSVWEVS